MSSNYEWQKQYTRQRIADRRREAKAHRLAAQAPATPRRRPVAALMKALRGLLPARRGAARPLRSDTAP